MIGPGSDKNQDFKRTYEENTGATEEDGGGNIGSESANSSPDRTLENKWGILVKLVMRPI